MRKLSNLNNNKGRTVYKDKNNLYSLDTHHGYIEILNKRGNHQGFIKFDGSIAKNGGKTDSSSKHDLKVK